MLYGNDIYYFDFYNDIKLLFNPHNLLKDIKRNHFMKKYIFGKIRRRKKEHCWNVLLHVAHKKKRFFRFLFKTGWYSIYYYIIHSKSRVNKANYNIRAYPGGGSFHLIEFQRVGSLSRPFITVDLISPPIIMNFRHRKWIAPPPSWWAINATGYHDYL